MGLFGFWPERFWPGKTEGELALMMVPFAGRY
jgi:hypothetical protein